MLVIRCGKEAIERTYQRDYDKIYGDRAKQTGPLNHDLNGPYNYFSTEFHPYYRHSDMHTMQSVSKTVTSITFGVAMQRGKFKIPPDSQIIRYFDGYNIANLDDRKRRITLRNLLTMQAGLEWHEDLAYDDPKNSADVMEVDARLGALRDRPADDGRSRHEVSRTTAARRNCWRTSSRK